MIPPLCLRFVRPFSKKHARPRSGGLESQVVQDQRLARTPRVAPRAPTYRNVALSVGVGHVRRAGSRLSLEARGVDRVVLDLVAEDPLGGVQETRRLGPIAAGGLE